MPIAYKILTTDQANALRRNEFTGAPVDQKDGYIHLSTADQVAETLQKHFAGQTALWLAAVDLTRCADSLRWEVSRGNQLFPHLYGSLTMTMVTALAPVDHAPDGTLILPAAHTNPHSP